MTRRRVTWGGRRERAETGSVQSNGLPGQATGTESRSTDQSSRAPLFAPEPGVARWRQAMHEDHNATTGLVIHAFVNRAEERIVIADRGSDDPLDWKGPEHRGVRRISALAGRERCHADARAMRCRRDTGARRWIGCCKPRRGGMPTHAVPRWTACLPRRKRRPWLKAWARETACATGDCALA